MFRLVTSKAKPIISFPRMRGDVPRFRTSHGVSLWFSPHARGCSELDVVLKAAGVVFPACAGMFLESSQRERNKKCFPRMRGDVPEEQDLLNGDGTFSPHTRGCSGGTRPAQR